MNKREEFRLARVGEMQHMSQLLLPEVTEAIATGDQVALRAELERLFKIIYNGTSFADLPDNADDAVGWWMDRIEPGLEAVTSESSPDVTADWLGTALVNGARVAGASTTRKVWISRRDAKVRPFHIEADGQEKEWEEPFTVCDGVEMMFPGDPVGSPSCWINCRCVAAPASMVFAEEGVHMSIGYEDDLDDDFYNDEDSLPDDEWEDVEDEQEDIANRPLLWHGCLAPEGVSSGDGRKFSTGALTWRDLPLPLRVQFADTGGHDGAVIIATIERIERRGNRLMSEGTFSESAEADKVVGMIADRSLRGVSIDADSAELAEGSEEGDVEFSKGRICAATLVAIPAFAEAYIALGPLLDEEQVVTSDTTIYADDAEDGGVGADFAISEKPWDGSASRFSPEEWRRSCVLHKCDGDEKSCHGLPVKEPGGALSRAGVHAAASRLNQVDAPPAAKASAKRALRGAYSQLGEEPPDALIASADEEEFGRGPGWVTNPKETRRLHAYWTKPGHKGYAKVRWGSPGDFTRLRRFLSKYIRPDLLNRVTAQWHHDALGYWPGEAGRPGNPPIGAKRKRRFNRMADQPINLVAASIASIDSGYFADPGLTEPTGLTVQEDGHVYGHIATWSTCHVGIKDVCTTAPHSQHDYAYFRTGAVLTEKGRISVGQITLGTGHAGLSARARQAAAHYDNTGTVVADVAAGEDEHGIWVAGKVRDTATSEQVHALQAGAISGDWRAIGGSLELIAALVVNVPGFPVQRPALAADAGEQLSLVAAGVVGQPDDDVKTLTTLVIQEMARRDELLSKMKTSKEIINRERVAALMASVTI